MTERYIFVCIYILDNGICDNTFDKFSLREAWCSGNLAYDTKIFNFAKESRKKSSSLNGWAIKKEGGVGVKGRFVGKYFVWVVTIYSKNRAILVCQKFRAEK